MTAARLGLQKTLIELLCATLAAVAIGACASGSAIVTGTTRAPITPDQVKVYLEAPAEFEVIGLVDASSDAGWTEQGSVDYAIAELKKQAGKLGANGVLLLSTGEKTTGFITGETYMFPVSAKTLHAQAIFVENQQALVPQDAN